MYEDLIRQVSLLERRLDNLVKPEIPLAASIRPLFSAYLSSTIGNVTGDGTVYTVPFDTEITDRNNNYNNVTGVFSAPVTGLYLLIAHVSAFGIGAAHTQGHLRITTSNRVYRPIYTNPNAAGAATFYPYGVCVIADMDAADVAIANIVISGGAKTVAAWGNAAPGTFFSGYLLI